MDRTLLEIFATEQTEHVQRIRSLMDALPSASPETTGAMYDELLRRAHTLKGASRAVGLDWTERLVHTMESLFVRWRRESILPSDDNRALIQRTLDGAEDILAWALGARSQPELGGLLRALQSLSEGGPDTAPPAAVRQDTSEAEKVSTVPHAAPGELVRVSTDLLDEVVRSASHLVHAAHEGSGVASHATAYAETVERAFAEFDQLKRNCSRYIRQNAEDPEFRPVLECFDFLERQTRMLVKGAREAAVLQEQHNRRMQLKIEDVHDNACRARMTPAQTVFGSFGAMVRDLANREGKQVEYRADGMEVQADREVLQALKDPVMHILRNAVSHGIEPSAERTAADKPPSGLIGLQVISRGDRLLVKLEDDGRGLDTAALAQESVRQGLITEEAARTASGESLARLIFQPGVSTSKRVTKLSGRGMGLSAVAEAMVSLQGDVRVQHRPGRGVTIELSAPMSISTQHVLLFREAGHVFALSATYVEQLFRFRSTDVRVINGAESLVIGQQPVPLVRLSDLLGLQKPVEDTETAGAADHPTYQAAILASGEDRAAVVIEAFLDEREAVVKDSGLPRDATGWSTGAIPMEDGSVAVMLSAAHLLQRFDVSSVAQATSFQPRADEAKKRILVVDDSVTTRAMERSLLEAHGYEVSVAVDGLEAWGAVRESAPDLVISDVDMPRMDGFELLERMKSEKSVAHIPVILVTSLESREEQEKGLSLGADAYIVKRKFDQRELLRIVRQIV